MERHPARTLKTRRMFLGLVAGAWAAGSASAQQAPSAKKAAAAAPAAKSPAELAAEQAAKAQDELRAIQAMTPILAEWEKRSARIVSLDAVFDKVDKTEAFGNQWFRGRALLQSPDKACLQFTKYVLDKDGKPLKVVGKDGKVAAQLEKEPDERIVCTGSEVLQYSWAAQKIIVHPLQQQAQLKALQEGPLPFLFNMKAVEAKQRYRMMLYKEFEKEYVIDIAPLQRIDQDSFAIARLWLNKETFLPNQLWLVKVGGKEHEEYKFNGTNDMIVANGTMDPKFFKFQKFDGWKVVVNKDGPANPDAGAPGVGQAAPRQQTKQR